MLSVGQLLKETRIKKGITLEKAEDVTKIRKKYLLALENDEFNLLPGRAYIAGFIRNYCDYLHLDSDRALAIFRREYADHQHTPVLPKNFTHPLNTSIIKITPRFAAIAATCLLLFIFFAYLFIEYRFVAIAPHLSLENPKDQQKVHTSTLTVVGQSDPDATVTINDQQVFLQVDGKFSAELTLVPGVNTIIVASSNKFGKKAKASRIVEYAP